MTSLSKALFTAAVCLVTAGTALADDGSAPPPPPPPGGGGGGGGAGGPGGGAAVVGGAGSKIIGADAVAILPVGDYSNAASFAIGALGRFEYGVNDMLAVTGRVGLIYNLTKDSGGVSPTLLMIPILAGATYKLGTSGVFAYGELGLTYITESATVMGMSFSQSWTKLSLGAGGGYRAGKMSARAGIYMPGSIDSGSGTTASSTTLLGLMASFGYDFAAM
jgi:hypothetical protein